MMTNEPTTLESAILDRVVAPQSGGWSAETARCILELRMPPKDWSRMSELSDKASEGALTPEERQQAEVYDRVGSLFLYAKAFFEQSNRVLNCAEEQLVAFYVHAYKTRIPKRSLRSHRRSYRVRQGACSRT